jgi:hypothetical protein
MAQDTHTVTIRPSSATPGIEGSFAHMIGRLNRLPPRSFSPFLQPDAEDLQDRADTIRIHIRAFQQYVSAFMADTANASWHVQLDRLYIDGLFDDLIGDCAGLLEKAADHAREDEGQRAA